MADPIWITLFPPITTLVVGSFAAYVALRQARTSTHVARTAAQQAETANRRHEEQTKADFHRRITENFIKAVDALTSDHVEVRIGGIYTLERIARESQDDYWNVIEMLCAFLRTRTRLEGRGSPEDSGLRIEIATALKAILRRRSVDIEREAKNNWTLMLDEVVLKKAELRNANLQRASLNRADLQTSDLHDARMTGAILRECNLMSANLTRALLSYVNLSGANLSSAILSRAHLNDANLESAVLEKCKFHDANLTNTKLSSANCEETDFSGATLKSATLVKANLTRTNFTKLTSIKQNSTRRILQRSCLLKVER